MPAAPDFSPEIRAEARRRIAATVEAARGRSRDTAMYLAMVELHRLCPDLNDLDLMGLYSVASVEVDGESGRR